MSVNAIMEEETARLINLADYAPEPLNQRRRTVMWNILCGFNEYNDGNQVLDEILSTFCRIRFGDIPKDCDEFAAAVWAVKIYYDDVTPDSVDTGPGMWTLPIVHLLNGHMLHRGMTPLAFHHLGEQDDHVATHERATHSNSIWLNREQAKVESREHIRAEMRRFLTDHMNSHFPEPEDEGPPEEGDHEEEPPAQRRRVLHLG